MIDTRKILPAEAELSADHGPLAMDAGSDQGLSGFVSLTEIAVCMKMRELALRGARWHRRCAECLPGESA